MSGKQSKDTTNVYQIIYKTGPCFGHCASYVLTFYLERHTAEYVGERDTVKHGTYTKALNDNEEAEFLGAMYDVSENTKPGDYLGNIVDLPINTVSIIIGDSHKDYRLRGFNLPKPLDNLQRLVAAFVKGEAWQRQK